jgi:hypothetical protein
MKSSQEAAAHSSPKGQLSAARGRELDALVAYQSKLNLEEEARRNEWKTHERVLEGRANTAIDATAAEYERMQRALDQQVLDMRDELARSTTQPRKTRIENMLNALLRELETSKSFGLTEDKRLKDQEAARAETSRSLSAGALRLYENTAKEVASDVQKLRNEVERLAVGTK